MTRHVPIIMYYVALRINCVGLYMHLDTVTFIAETDLISVSMHLQMHCRYIKRNKNSDGHKRYEWLDDYITESLLWCIK